MPNYPFSGSGRDLYMRADFGGPIPATGKSTFSERPPVSPINSICSRTDTMPRYYNDGTGRDIYLSGHLSKIPSTGKANFSERPPSKQASKRHVRTDMLPPFTPSGSGRDTFHRVEYRDKEDACPNDGAQTWSQRVSEYFNPMVMDAFSLRPQLVLCSPEAFSELNENLRRPTTALGCLCKEAKSPPCVNYSMKIMVQVEGP
ncbi:hypothetical protein AURANDRAFT_67789 [Aureococcus anophagefferens]|uniref:Uncharacterized protein n=1 Tax=Aureococcus anophagefferens TaxID=44056 RepID=F0YME3_AURAN|nr:hypothetical protein AURANDRAFT_67789 [Aureococcus anophagefferens]EGB03730.1 hypothetical protein AURANDRAFT_67789 [Aureococcus anophagefferens]|eukprot:XP_009041585.1 hypothetical protein AURANDRAFT_67789 [Aureococcus anophagefferens]